jgi:hypothetical protein
MPAVDTSSTMPQQQQHLLQAGRETERREYEKILT